MRSVPVPPSIALGNLGLGELSGECSGADRQDASPHHRVAERVAFAKDEAVVADCCDGAETDADDGEQGDQRAKHGQV